MSRSLYRIWPLLVAAALAASAARAALPQDLPAPTPTPTNVEVNSPTQPRPGRYRQHLDQKLIHDMVRDRNPFDAFELARERGDDFFDNLFLFDETFGVGANVGQGQKFSRVPRADLKGPGEWASHFPARATGPNAASCIECHTSVAHDGGGLAVTNAIRDPLHSGTPSRMINRNTTHLFGQGALQVLAEEMTEELHRIRDEAKARACHDHETQPVTRELLTKGTSYGKITVRQVFDAHGEAQCQIITSGVRGIDTDLVVRPFQWKGSVAFIRDFNRGAAHNENGLEAVEIAGDDVDGDGDGVANEVSVGDMTALTVYVASQPRPLTKVAIARMKRIPELGAWELASIERGRAVFDRVGCASCHTPEMRTRNTVFSEPSQNPFFRDLVFPAGQDPVSRHLDPKYAVKFDLTRDLGYEFNFERDEQGRMRVELFSDLKRHDLGPEVAESIDEVGTGASIWLTRPLWGLGSTRPYMHDGRATTVPEAIRWHGGEAAGSRALYDSLPSQSKEDLVNFLMNLRLWKLPDFDS